MKHQDVAVCVDSDAGHLDEIPRTGGRAGRVRHLGGPIRNLFVAHGESVQTESRGVALLTHGEERQAGCEQAHTKEAHMEYSLNLPDRKMEFIAKRAPATCESRRSAGAAVSSVVPVEFEVQRSARPSPDSVVRRDQANRIRDLLDGGLNPL